MTKEEYRYWQELARRYFEAETTEEEERTLKCFVVSPQAEGKEWDELRAVMGYTVVGKHLHGQTQRRARIRRMPRWTRIAATVAILVALGTLPWLTSQEANTQDICIAYINGQPVTDHEQVMAAMHHAMTHVQQVEPMVTVEQQLDEIFKIMKDK